MFLEDHWRIWAGVVAGATAAAWGSLAVTMQVLLGLQALDVAAGVLAAFARGELDPELGRRGVALKALTWIVVIGVTIAADALNQQFGLAIPAGAAIAGYFSMQELVSIVQNADRGGLPVPQVLRDALARTDQRPRSSPPEQA